MAHASSASFHPSKVTQSAHAEVCHVCGQENRDADSLSSRLTRATKWGHCPVHNEPRVPVAHTTGPTRGFVTLRCKLFFERVGQGRGCWHASRFQGDMSVLPQNVQGIVRELRADVSWQLRNGVSSASTSV